MVYEGIYDAKNAVDHLSGFNVAGRLVWRSWVVFFCQILAERCRYLVVLYYNAVKQQKKLDAQKAKEEIEFARKKLGLTDDDDDD